MPEKPVERVRRALTPSKDSLFDRVILAILRGALATALVAAAVIAWVEVVLHV